MKVSYFGYYFERHEDQVRYLADIRPLLRGFARFDNPEYKNSFTHTGENLYLFRRPNDLYMFLITRDQEIIKGIRSDNITVSEIQDILAAEGESIGFASYLYLKQHYFGFASTVMAPRFQTFTGFVNSILQSVGQSNVKFVSKPLMQRSTRAQVLDMPIHGAATFDLDADSGLAREIGEQLNLVDDDFGSVASLRVKVVPKFRQNIRDATAKLIQHLPDDGLSKFTVKAKSDVNDKLTDLYLASEGHISDEIENREERALADEIEYRITSNQVLAEKVEEHAGDEQFQKVEARFINHLSDADNWPDSLVAL